MSEVSLPRTQHIIASGGIMLLGLWVAYISYSSEPAAAFLFPRLISSFFVVLATWTFVKACLGWSKVGGGLTGGSMMKLLPGLIVALIYVFWAAKGLGFYTATSVAFFALLTLYDPAPHTALKTWIKRILVTAGFMAVMYGLFAKLLKVYTPQEIFF